MSQHWSDYWTGGHLTSLPQDYALNYDGALLDFWQEQFARVPSGGGMLDVCTGNGAIAFMAARWFAQAGRQVAIVGVDAARIQPGVLADRHDDLRAVYERIEFLGEQPVEGLTLESASFDLVTSQYGIEYCDWSRAAAQVGRLLRPNGMFAMVCHAADSAMMNAMRQESLAFDRVQQLRLPQTLQRFLSGQLSFSRMQDSLRQALRQLPTHAGLASHPLIVHVTRSAAGILRLDEAALRMRRAELKSFLDRLLLGRDRLADMLRVNAAIAQRPDWHQVFSEHGLHLCEIRQVEHQGRFHCGTAYRYIR